MRRTIRISGLLTVLVGFIVAVGCGTPEPALPGGIKPAGGEKDYGMPQPLKEKKDKLPKGIELISD